MLINAIVFMQIFFEKTIMNLFNSGLQRSNDIILSLLSLNFCFLFIWIISKYQFSSVAESHLSGFRNTYKKTMFADNIGWLINFHNHPFPKYIIGLTYLVMTIYR